VSAAAPTLAAPSLTGPAFWFLRHGETDWNAQGLSQGNVDIPLNATGIAQAHAAAALLVNRGIASIMCSPLSRARDTAQVVATALDLGVSILEDLREVAFGVHEGTPMADLWFGEWVAGTSTPEGAESFVELRNRARRAIIVAQAQKAPVLVVAHGALFRALRAEMGLPPNIRTPNAQPLFCEPGTPWTLTAATRT
jgi:broad specificity phosphatase PhoE